MKIAIMGSGGVGGYFGARLAATGTTSPSSRVVRTLTRFAAMDYGCRVPSVMFT